MRKLILIGSVILMTGLANAQSFKEKYLKKYSSSWEFTITDSMRATIPAALDSFYVQKTGYRFWENQKLIRKKEVYDEFDRIEQILMENSFFNGEEFDFALIICESEYIFIYKGLRRSYRLDNKTLIQRVNLSEDSVNLPFIGIFEQNQKDSINIIRELAKSQNENSTNNLRAIKSGKKQLEIVLYKKGEIELIYLTI